MSGRKEKTSRLLLLSGILLCIMTGYLLTHSSGSSVSSGRKNESDIIVASQTSSDDSTSDDPEPVSVKLTATPTPAVSATPVPSPSPEASEEAKKGVWTASGSSWQFLVDGIPHTGWLYDTDGHHYYFNSDGIMQTGWLDENGKRYYLDEDGIMQTGTLVIDGTEYEFLKDGTLKDYKSEETASPTPEASAGEETENTAKTESAEKKSLKQIALTFDDGPGEFTAELLDFLEERQAKATFFLVGQEIPNYPDVLKRMDELGCEIGNHSFDHTDLTKLTQDEITDKLRSVDDLILEQTGHKSTLLRPPYGNINDDVRAAASVPMILWSVDTLDWKTQNPDSIVTEVLDHVQDGSVILMHDTYKSTLEAVKILIPKLQEEGYELLTVHELAAAKQTELKPGTAYGSIT
ncbi:MAG: polysaccharide deacetylase family protein [Blautia sp.]|nr:polysaccharide deacetylase family protein [Blautia sp.]MDY5031818.1 polysaccharide deacetylase family protein [Blautia sp.]